MADAFVMDRRAVLDRLGGDEEIFAMMVDMYLQDVDSNAAALAVAFADGDAAILTREAHTVKALLATFSDDLGAADAFDLEKRAKLGQIDGLQPAVTALQARLREVADVLRPELGAAG